MPILWVMQIAARLPIRKPANADKTTTSTQIAYQPPYT